MEYLFPKQILDFGEVKHQVYTMEEWLNPICDTQIPEAAAGFALGAATYIAGWFFHWPSAFLIIPVISLLLGLHQLLVWSRGIIGEHIMEQRWADPAYIEAKKMLEDAYDSLEGMQKKFNIAYRVKELYTRFADNMQVDIQHCGDAYTVKFSATVCKNLGDQISYTDQDFASFDMSREMVEKTFRENTVDFSWLDGEAASARENLCRTAKRLSEKLSENSVVQKVLKTKPEEQKFLLACQDDNIL